MSKPPGMHHHQNHVKRFAWMSLALLLTTYLAWEIFWFTRVGLRFIKWHTHLMLYVYIWLAGYFILRFILFKKSPKAFGNGLLAFSIAVFMLFIIEAFFEITGNNKTYLEKSTGSYISHYQPPVQSHYHVYTPGKTQMMLKHEYSFHRKSNSLGFIDAEWEVQKSKGEIRILALGDSFTEGDGAPFDSSYVALLRQKLRDESGFYTVMNAGISGSDPFNNFINLMDLLSVYQPDYIIQSLSSFDLLHDILIKGGMERFKPDGTLQYSRAPWWEPVYALNCISRVFFHKAGYNELLRKGDLSQEDEKRLNELVAGLFREYASFCKRNDIKLFVVLRPDRIEIENNRYLFDFSEISRELEMNEALIFIDLLREYRDYIAQTKTIAADYFWKHDGHHNSKGYEMMASAILKNISPHLNGTYNRQYK